MHWMLLRLSSALTEMGVFKDLNFLLFLTNNISLITKLLSAKQFLDINRFKNLFFFRLDFSLTFVEIQDHPCCENLTTDVFKSKIQIG